ncbi:hypothetical protein QJS10_CPB12g00238 [Acorus calamus]|uniref:Protein MIZU-KUSSEI 1 n=1 Tax=Acorus calamus TaxID=4465 RepID=A0AAV9DSD1_ACOCL|nr:hypothetical protein QJS10_CPB12g00238 [Acorus calamus]
MKTILARSTHETSFSRRHFHWRKKTLVGDEAEVEGDPIEPPKTTTYEQKVCPTNVVGGGGSGGGGEVKKRRPSAVAVIKLKWALASATLMRQRPRSGPPGLGPRVTGTLYGHRKGHVQLAFQDGPRSGPAFLIELATPTAGLVREMASGMVRVALECDRRARPRPSEDEKPRRLIDEPMWRTYCNGRMRGFASRRECGPSDWRVFNAVEMVSMGAGVLPGFDGPGLDGPGLGEVMYMRAGFERVVGSKDSEAFYMINPDPKSGGPELSIYLLRV